MTQLTRGELIAKIIAKTDEIHHQTAKIERIEALDRMHVRQRDDYQVKLIDAKLRAEQWHQAYNELLVQSTGMIVNGTGANVVFNAPAETLSNYVAPTIPVVNVNMDELHKADLESAGLLTEAADRIESLEAQLDRVRAIIKGPYTAAYDLADDLRSILFP